MDELRGVITTHQSMHVENEKPVESLNQNDTDLDGRFVFFPLVKRIKKYSVGNPEHKKTPNQLLLPARERDSFSSSVGNCINPDRR